MQSNNPQTPGADTSMRREADILAAMAAAGSLEIQLKLSAELETFRSNRITAARRADSLDLDAVSQVDRWSHNPDPASERTSMASDWIMDVPVAEHTAAERDRTMIAEASLWFTSVREDVKTDREEFDIQAVGAAEYAASEFGEDAPAAARTFLAHLTSLAGRKIAEDLSTMPVGTTQTGPPATTEPMDTIEAPTDTGPAEVDHSGPGDNPSLSGGTSPAGEESTEPVSQSATENNAGDSGDSAAPIDNTPASPTVLSPASRGAKRAALMQMLAAAVKCLACGEAIHKDDNGKWRHSEYLYQRGHQRNHVAVPANAKDAAYAPEIAGSPWSGEANDEENAAQVAAPAPVPPRPSIDASPWSGAASEEELGYNSPVADPYQNVDRSTPVGANPWSGQANDEELAYNSPPRQAAYSHEISGSPWSGEASQEETANNTPTQYKVKFDHPNGASYSTTVAVPPGHGPEHAIQNVRNLFRNVGETAHAKWNAEPISNPWDGAGNNEGNSPKKTSAVPEPNGLNSEVDFKANPDPNDSLSLGPGDEGEWPAPADGNPQTMSNPETPRGATAALFDAATDERVAVAEIDHELASTAAADGVIHVDGDLMVIAAEIAAEPYVKGPVRRVYVGVEAACEDGQEPYGDPGGAQMPPGASAPAEEPYDLYDDSQGPEYDDMVGEAPNSL